LIVEGSRKVCIGPAEVAKKEQLKGSFLYVRRMRFLSIKKMRNKANKRID